MSALRVAIVHDYLNQRGGAERVVARIHRLFPDAPIHTSILDRDRLWPALSDATIIASWMQRIPGIHRHFKKLFWLYPLVFERMNLTGYDLVLSSSSTYAKAVRTRPGAVHVCYCHGPTRFLWDRERYLDGEEVSGPMQSLLRPIFRRLERWDKKAAKRPDVMIANSRWIAARIARIYGREAEVVYPPVDTERFHVEPGLARSSHLGSEGPRPYLVVARLVGYKRVDLAVNACARLGRPLVVVGDGPSRASIEALGNGLVRFVRRPSDAELPHLYARSKALLVGAEEDFGITMVEAHAAGIPVIALGRGGAAEIVTDGVDGILFQSQDTDAMEAAIVRSEQVPWDKEKLRASAQRFSEASFASRYLEIIERALREHGLTLSR